ncbi:MAG: transcriptional regulator [Magnetococcales bacterium]|nr:transcriptional regulator [Magnetococcales bacterium]
MSKKRNLFDELSQSIDEAQQFDSGKITLKTTKVEAQPPLHIDAKTVLETRESLHLSRGVFARWLRVSPRTLENWEQGRSRPNSQAAALILMIRKFPDTVDRLAVLS